MPPGEANSPARRIYYAMQTAYIGTEEERAVARVQARELCDQFASHTTSRLAVEILETAMAAIAKDRCYDALKLVRRIIRHEDSVCGRTLAVPCRMVAQ
jgi:flagellar protein FlbT